MKNRLLLPAIVIVLSFLIQACSSGSDTVIIAGQVIDQNSGNPINEAVVEVTQPSNLQQTALTDSAGNFSFDVNPNANEAINVSLEISKQGYNSTTTSFKLAPETNVDDLTIELQSTSSDEGDGEESVGGEPEGPAAIVLQNVSNPAINIKETGDQVSTAFTFTVQDSAGRPLDNKGAVDVNFSIISGPGGSEEIIPTTARTNSQGKVTTSLFSGNVAGPVKVQASIERPELGITIKSTPVLIAIHGGFPDDNHFSIAANKYNFEGWSINNVRNEITVIVGDKFSNPVKPGTVVYFKTTGGVIQGSGQTDDDGIVSVDLISGDPRPTDNITGSGGRPGYSTITASTIDENDNVIEKEINVVFATTHAVIDPTCQTNCVDSKTFDIPANGGASFTYTVTDDNGNPMPVGTTITIEAGQDLEVTGDTDLTLGNPSLFPGPGTTEFSFSIRDTDELSNDPAPATIKITVTTPSGSSTTNSELSGTRRKSF
jgi:protocatechuate 3,4-dioxygenase beta subunit